MWAVEVLVLVALFVRMSSADCGFPEPSVEWVSTDWYGACASAMKDVGGAYIVVKSDVVCEVGAVAAAAVCLVSFFGSNIADVVLVVAVRACGSSMWLILARG